MCVTVRNIRQCKHYRPVNVHVCVRVRSHVHEFVYTILYTCMCVTVRNVEHKLHTFANVHACVRSRVREFPYTILYMCT